MAKQGFATSDRRKVEVLNGTSKAVSKAECGSVFVVMNTCLAISVPSAADVGDGWWCKFIVGETGTTQIDITLGAGTISLLNISSDGTAGAVSSQAGNILRIEHDAGGNSDPNPGDEIEILAANGQWFARALTDN